LTGVQKRSTWKVEQFTSPFELALCVLAFILFAWLSSTIEIFLLSSVAWPTAVLALAFWWGFQWAGSSTSTNVGRPLFVGTGLVLVVESLISYGDLTMPLPIEILLGGCLGSTALIFLERSIIGPRRGREKVLLVGCGPVGARVAKLLGPQVIGVIGREQAGVSPELAWLGDTSTLDNVIEKHQPSILVIDSVDWRRQISPRRLLALKLDGIEVESAEAVHRRLFQRISAEHLDGSDLILPDTLRTNRRVIAFQAVYSNLIALAFLVTLWPIIILLGIVSRLAAGGGQLFENVECIGFQRIPFSRRKFHTRRAVTGQTTAIGRILLFLRLTYLPQLINVVRGEMALFGPKPVRSVFSNHIESLLPSYSYRFSMKPGIFNWAQANVGREGSSRPNPVRSLVLSRQEECLCFGYELYYLEYGSPFMDLDILRRTILRKR